MLTEEIVFPERGNFFSNIFIHSVFFMKPFPSTSERTSHRSSSSFSSSFACHTTWERLSRRESEGGKKGTDPFLSFRKGKTTTRRNKRRRRRERPLLTGASGPNPGTSKGGGGGGRKEEHYSIPTTLFFSLFRSFYLVRFLDFINLSVMAVTFFRGTVSPRWQQPFQSICSLLLST